MAGASQLAADVPPLQQARLQLFSAPGASRWFDAAPSSTLDRQLTSKELSVSLDLLLGVDVFDVSCICCFCGSVSDTNGIHALSCTAGGDITLRHNAVRDIIFHFCRRRYFSFFLLIPQDVGLSVRLTLPHDAAKLVFSYKNSTL